MDNAESLRQQFKSAFGIRAAGSRVKVHICPPIQIGDSEWVFGLRRCESSEDVVWMCLNADLIAGFSAQHQMANEINTKIVQMALSVCSINGKPLFQFVGIEIADDDFAKITDLNNPPDNIRFAAAKVFLMEYVTHIDDYNVIDWVFDQYSLAFPPSIQFPTPDQPPADTVFLCGSCHFKTVMTPDQMVVLSDSIATRGGIVCPSCGEIAKEKVKATEAEDNDPLSRPGTGS